MRVNNQQRYLAFFTFLALIAILAIQVNWLFNAAKLEEDNFNQLVNKALNEAKHEIGKTAATCTDMNDFLCGNPGKDKVRKKKIAEIDSIISAKLAYYNISLDYTFEVAETDVKESGKKLFRAKCYRQDLNGLLEKEGIKILVEFPGRNQFLLGQLRGTFLLAFFSIIFVMISYLLTSRMFRKERQMLQQTSDFINNMVHEFQTPLSNIRFAASLIKKKESNINDPKISEYLSVIVAENHKMEKNVEEILKISCNNNENPYEDVDLNKIISQICSEFKPRIESLNGEIDCSHESQAVTFKGSPDHFKLIFSNLIDNAIKYSPENPHITISTKKLSGGIQIKVKDNGLGIEKKYQTQIFEKYFRVPTGDIHNVKGFGLGLTYVKKLVEGYRGKIDVVSSKGSGTVFTIFLPLENEAK